ncbi:MAG: 4Fe-4S dicluster domain-containing protein [Planctomycetaceae bacterium]|nr:4Fe-4S dicluster domain-containing protein [Planctomycetaceae bacterium]
MTTSHSDPLNAGPMDNSLRPPVDREQIEERDLLTSCVHCGLCLEVCPTYQLTGDENNSPRGRLRLWREEADGRLEPDEWTTEYTSDCVGCLACESACPANVPYGEILEAVRHEHHSRGRTSVRWMLRMAGRLAFHLSLMNLAALPVRILRRSGLPLPPLLFPGQPAGTQSTAAYARTMMERHRPDGPRVALLTGCLMESVFREINFATVRVLIENNIQVIVPPNQSCCGAFHEHLGMDRIEELRSRNRSAFSAARVDAVVTNSSGCGLALQKTLAGVVPVRDVLDFLGQFDLKHRILRESDARVYVDLPCHLIHGQKLSGIPSSVLDATGIPWQLAPNAHDCCGSGGAYNIQKPENARAILARKAEFLNNAEGDPVILATSNHVCMMQWHSAGRLGLVSRPYQVRHVIQLLDPAEQQALRKLRGPHHS